MEIDHKTELHQLEQIQNELISEVNNIDDRIIDEHDKMTLLQMGVIANKKKKRNRSYNHTLNSNGFNRVARMKKSNTSTHN